MNLNLGSGTNRKQDYISVDKYVPEADEHWDITSTWPHDDESVDNIYACHVIEHLSRKEFGDFVAEVNRVLKPGGTIEILCPDIILVCIKFLADPNDGYSMMQLYGLQSNDGEFHKNGFTLDSLKRAFTGYAAENLPPTDDTELHMRFTKHV